MDKILELKQKAFKAIKDARAILEKAQKESRAMNGEESTNYDKAFADATTFKAEAERLEKQENLERSLELPESRKVGSEKPGAAGEEKREKEHRAAIMKYIITGDATELRALSADVAGEGGNMLPAAMSSDILTGLDNLLFMRQICDVLPPVQGAVSLGLPYISADATDAEWTSEIVGATADDTFAIGKRSLTPHLLLKLVKASMKLLQLSPRAEQLIIQRIAYKMAVPQENKFLNGTGTTMPLGVFVASSDGINTDRDVATNNVATAFTADGLIDCKYAVAAQYRKNASWIMSRAAVKMASKLKDGEQRYMWQPSLIAGKPDTLLGAPIFESEYAPSTFTAGLYVGIYGDFKYYQIVDSLNMSIQRLNELYAATNQIGFIPRLYVDGMPVLPAAFARVKLGA